MTSCSTINTKSFYIPVIGPVCVYMYKCLFVYTSVCMCDPTCMFGDFMCVFVHICTSGAHVCGCMYICMY